MSTINGLPPGRVKGKCTICNGTVSPITWLCDKCVYKIGSHNINGIAEIKFDTTYHDFGSLIQGEQASFTFKFKNTGKADLIINDAYSTCGCTIPSYSKEPIAPGAKGEIEVVFDSAGKRGVQYKTVVLKLNTKRKEKSLAIKVNVLEK